MITVYTDKQVAHYDPTHTTALRNAFAKNMNRKFNELILTVKKAIIVQDCFGLEKLNLVANKMTPPSWQKFSYLSNAKKVEEFMKWLQEQVNKGILDVRVMEQVGDAIDSNWMNLYLFDSYKRGVIRARYEMRKAGYDVPTIEESGGVGSIMTLPFHVDRIGLIYTRAYNELKGVTDAMSQQISRILAQGIADGDGALLLSRKITATINGMNAANLGITDSLGRYIPAQRRAEMIARTELIRAHHQATIQEYRSWELEGVRVQGEWRTAGDDRVCEKCASLEGKIFTLKEIENMIPLHPQCRCIALPYAKEIVEFMKNNPV